MVATPQNPQEFGRTDSLYYQWLVIIDVIENNLSLILEHTNVRKTELDFFQSGLFK